MRLLPGSAYHLATARYSFIEIRLDALTPAEAAAHVSRVREELALFGLLIDGERSLPVPVLPPPPEVAPEAVDSAAASGTMMGATGAVTMSTTTTLTPHQQRTKEADAAAAAKAVPPPTIPGPPQRDAALQSVPVMQRAAPTIKDPDAPSTELQRGKIRAMARKGENHRLLAEWLKARGLVGIDVLRKGEASALIDHLMAQG